MKLYPTPKKKTFEPVIQTEFLEIPGKIELSIELKSLHEKLLNLAKHQNSEYYNRLFDQQNSLLDNVAKSIEKHFSGLLKKIEDTNDGNINILFSKYNANLWFRLRRILNDYRDETLIIIEKKHCKRV